MVMEVHLHELHAWAEQGGVAVRSATAGVPIRYYVVEGDLTFCKQAGLSLAAYLNRAMKLYRLFPRSRLVNSVKLGMLV